MSKNLDIGQFYYPAMIYTHMVYITLVHLYGRPLQAASTGHQPVLNS